MNLMMIMIMMMMMMMMLGLMNTKMLLIWIIITHIKYFFNLYGFNMYDMISLYIIKVMIFILNWHKEKSNSAWYTYSIGPLIKIRLYYFHVFQQIFCAICLSSSKINHLGQIHFYIRRHNIYCFNINKARKKYFSKG